jgi:hypothetical protein
VLPTQANLLEGSYPVVGEQTMQFRKAGQPLAPTGATLDMVNLFVAKSASQTVLSGIAGATGRSIAVIPTTSVPPSLDANLVSTNKVAKWTKGGQTCAPISKLY